MKVEYYSIVICLLIFFISIASASAVECDQADVINETDSGEVTIEQADEACDDAVLGIAVDESGDAFSDENISIASDIEINGIYVDGIIGAPISMDDLLGDSGGALYTAIMGTGTGGTATLSADYAATSRSTATASGVCTYYTDVYIDHRLTFDGQNHTINLNNFGRAFQVKSDVQGLVFKNTTFINGDSYTNRDQSGANYKRFINQNDKVLGNKIISQII